MNSQLKSDLNELDKKINIDSVDTKKYFYEFSKIIEKYFEYDKESIIEFLNTLIIEYPKINNMLVKIINSHLNEIRTKGLNKVFTKKMQALIIDVIASLNDINTYKTQETGTQVQMLHRYITEYRENLKLTDEDELELWKRVEQNDEIAKKIIIQANLGLARQNANKYYGSHLSFDDLFQEGVCGLIKAIENYDYKLGIKFSTHATIWIKQAITRAIANYERTIRIPVHVWDDLNKFRRIKRKLTIELSREPSLEEMAKEMAIPINKLKKLLYNTQEVVSLDLPVNDNDDSFLGMFIPSSSDIDETEITSLADDVKNALNNSSLNERQRKVIYLRIYHKYTLEKVGEILNITRERVRQIENRALEILSDDTNFKAINEKSNDKEMEENNLSKSNSILEYYNKKGINNYDIFKVMSLLDITDIKLILNKYGKKLLNVRILNTKQEKRINQLLEVIIPKYYKEYLLFKDGLISFMNLSIDEINSIIDKLPNNIKELCFKQFDKKSLSFNNIKLNDGDFRILFRSLYSQKHLIYLKQISLKDINYLKLLLHRDTKLLLDKIIENNNLDLSTYELSVINKVNLEIIQYQKLKKGLTYLIEGFSTNFIKKKINELPINEIVFIYHIFDKDNLNYKLKRDLTENEFIKLWNIFITKDFTLRKFFISADVLKHEKNIYDSIEPIINLSSFKALTNIFGIENSIIIMLNLLKETQLEFKEMIESIDLSFDLNDELLESYQPNIDKFIEEYYSLLHVQNYKSSVLK